MSYFARSDELPEWAAQIPEGWDPPKHRRGGWGRAGVFAVVACLVWLACPTAAFAQQTVAITSIATDGEVDASEKWAGFVIAGTTKQVVGGVEMDAAGIPVTVTIGTGSLNETSDSDGEWSVTVPPDQDYITDGNGQTVTVEANFVGGNETGTANFDVNLTLPLSVDDDIAGDDKINIEEKKSGFTISGQTDIIDGVAVKVTLGTQTWNTTSAIPGGETTARWSVTVESNESYITGTSLSLEVEATLSGYEDKTVTRTLPVDLVAPMVSYTAPSRLFVGKPISTMSPTTDDTDIFFYESDSLPLPLAVTQEGGFITGAPAEINNSTHTATVTVTDDFGNTANVMIVFPVVEPVPTVRILPQILTVREGGSAQYTVVLDTRPGENVTITVMAMENSDPHLTADPVTLTFTDSDWSEPQTVRISAAEDEDGSDGNGFFSHSVTSSVDSPYDGIGAPRVRAIEDDNDSIGVTVSPTTLSVPEGGSATYTVRLGTKPLYDVTVEATSDHGSDDDLTVSSDTDMDTYTDSVTLTFTNSNWNAEQTVTVSAAEDDADEVDGVAIFSHSTASNDEDYYPIDVDPVTATEADNEKVVTVAIQTDVSAPVDGAFEVTITFSEPVTGFERSEIAVTNGSVTDFSGSGTTYKAEITPSKNGEVIVEVGANVVEYGVGNGNQAAELLVIEAELDLLVSYQEESYTAREGGEMVAVTVKLSQGWDEELAIPIRVTRPEATEVADYTLDGLEEWDAQEGTGRLTFPAEETEQTFTIEANHDGDEDDETVELGFGELPEIVMAGQPAVATVVLKDKGLVELKVSFRKAEYEIGEGEQADIEVKVAPTADRRVEVPLVVAPKGGATDEDYSGVPAKVVFEEGASEGTISVEVLADEVNDPGEGIVLSFGELPEAVSGGEISQTTVNFRQQRTAEQFSQTLEAALAVMARSMGESAQTVIQGRFERYRQWSRLRAAGAAQPGSDNGAAAASPGESQRIGSESLEGSGRRRAEGPVVQSAGGEAGATATMGSSGESGDRESGMQGAWLQNASLGGLTGLFGHGQGDAGVSTGSGMGPSGTGPTVGLGGQPGYGQDRFQGSGTRNSSLRSGSGEYSGRRNRELNLAGVSFELPLAGQQKGTSRSWVPALWGQGDLQRFNGNLTRYEMSYRGGLEAAHVGLDLYANDEVLAGLSFMRSWGNMDYSDDGIDGTLGSRMNTFHPYLYWQPTERVSVWGMGGLGRGRVDVNEPGRSHNFEADFRMFSGGVRAVLWKRGSNEMGLRADAFTAQLGTEVSEDIAKVRGEAHRARLMLEWVHTKQLSAGRSLSLKVEAGGRFDGGDAERGSGAETGFRLGYLDANSGLDVAILGRVLVVHKSDYRDWGVGVQASWDPGEKQRGFRASVTSTRGQDGGGRTTLWNNANTVTRPPGMGAMGMGSQSRMESEVAYGGLRVLGLPGALTPYSRLRWTGYGRELAMGTQWSLPLRSQLALPLMLELEVMRRKNRTGPADLAVLGRMSITF